VHHGFDRAEGLDNSPGLLSRDVLVLCSKSSNPVVLIPERAVIAFRAYSTSFELSLLCSSQEGTVMRFCRCPVGKNDLGGQCSLVDASRSQA
jgi:hypothetical protein